MILLGEMNVVFNWIRKLYIFVKYINGLAPNQ